MSMTEIPCTAYYIDDDPEHRTPCKCPKCGGFLRFDGDERPVCNKCGVELVMIPDIDDESGEQMDWGKICPTGEPKNKAIRGEELRVKRLVKAGHKAWKAWL